jgi:hypothetical protein
MIFRWIFDVSNVFTLHLPQNAILNRNQPGTMNSYGRYTVSYTPSDDPTEYLQTSVQMSISSEATLSDMTAFFTDFLRASGYVFEGALEIVNE